MTATRYPPASWKGDGDSGGSYTGAPWRVVLHTTETTGVPGYNGGGSAPHLTYQPTNGLWVQHTDLGVAARALKNVSGGVETNRANALQVEIVCYSDGNVAAGSSSRLWVGDLSPMALADIADFVSWAGATFGVGMFWPGRAALSYGQANAAGFRMTGDDWELFNGVCGHQHVPENDHWDPGALDWSQVVGLTDQGGDEMPWTKPGDPVETLTDADAVFAYQGTIFAGSNVASYLMSVSEREAREGMILGHAREVDALMLQDERLSDGGH